MANSTSAGMRIDVMSVSDVFALDQVSDIKCFTDYREDPDPDFDVNKVIKYVVLLYSQDSVLNKKPMPQLKDRWQKAARIAGIDPEDPEVASSFFDLLNDKIRNLIIDFLIDEQPLLWSERCIVEAQMRENQKIRLKPIQNKIAAPVKKRNRKKDEQPEEEDKPGEEQDDAYILAASNKKHSLTDHFNKYFELIKKYDLHIFSDHELIKEASVKRHRKTIESIAD